MSVMTQSPTYDSRSVEEWMDMAGSGKVALPDFQRSVVWQPALTAEYIKALLESRPTGIFLILKATSPPQFSVRRLSEVEGTQGSDAAVDELVLDGQQRLTSLWQALHGRAKHRYFIRVANLANADLEVERVEWRSHRWSNPRKMYRDNWVPVDSLMDTVAVKAWCTEAAKSSPASKDQSVEGPKDAYESAYESLLELRTRLLHKPHLHYCSLAASTDRDTAVDIFINVNKSVTKLKPVDIAVAIAEADHQENLRQRVEGYIERSSEITHYFPGPAQKTIPEVAAWMLKVACLKVSTPNGLDGLPPKDMHFPSAVRQLLDGDKATVAARITQFEDDLDTALRFVSARGAATKRTLPSMVPVLVIAALQEALRPHSGQAEEVNRLVTAYLWRAFATDRYGRQANDRLLEDYRGLLRCLAKVGAGEELAAEEIANIVPAFDDKCHALPTASQVKQAGWIGSGSRLGRAIASVVMRGKPLDWLTGRPMTSQWVRQLERDGALVRHFLFPPATFGDKAKRGINGVLLAKTTPWPKAKDSDDLVKAALKHDPGLDPFELQVRVQSHLVAYNALVDHEGTNGYRYSSFAGYRAQHLCAEIGKLTSL